MQVVGVDFGTTNVRIAVWDPDKPDTLPELRHLDTADSFTMPAVIAFQKAPDGTVTPVIGQAADELNDQSPDVVVVRNIKRWALSSDPFVAWNLDVRGVVKDDWWNPRTRSVEIFGDQYPVKEIMSLILARALELAGVTGQFAWRAGCPVHTGLDYRSELADILSELGGSERKLAWVVEEPILFLVLALELGGLKPGSYLVYDVGGGSFDCAIAEVEPNGEMVVYSSQGDSSLGGVFLDDRLSQKLHYGGAPHDLRVAKEVLTPDNPTVSVDISTTLSLDDLKSVLAESGFVDDTTLPIREAYITAKVLWKRGEGESPIGMVPPSCQLGKLPGALREDLEGIILFGGSTKSPALQESLREKFGPEKIFTAEDLIPEEIPDPHLTALSAGARYVSGGDYNPLYTNRLPINVTLRNTQTGNSVEYTPYQHFTRNFHPVKPFASRCVAHQAGAEGDYQLTVADADGKNLIGEPVEVHRNRLPRTSQDSPMFMIDTLGQIWVGNHDRWLMEISEPPWQTGRQSEVRRTIMENQQRHEEQERERINLLLSENPWGWQAGHG